MNSVGKLLVVAGDVGGARAILPALRELERRRTEFDVVDHGFIVTEMPSSWCRVRLPQDPALRVELLQAKYRACVFGTSVSDPYPLHVARSARVAGLPIGCVLDNWANYVKRLETDGEPALMPEMYAIMDELAREGAIRDGIAPDCLRIVGQPALAALGNQFRACRVVDSRENAFRRSGWGVAGRKLIAFISEPAEQDQGRDISNPRFRGYTEKTVLRSLSGHLQRFHNDVQIGLVPHPREQVEGLMAEWENCRGRLIGGRLAVDSGREAVFLADAVCGMASLLLYEAVLLAKPVLSFQPGLRLPQLEFLRKKGVKFFVSEETVAADTVGCWIEQMMAGSGRGCSSHPEIDLHRQSPALLADFLEQLLVCLPAKKKRIRSCRQ